MTGITIGVIVLIMLIVGFIFGRSRRISGVEATESLKIKRENHGLMNRS